VKTAAVDETGFEAWLGRQRDRADSIGHLARKVAGGGELSSYDPIGSARWEHARWIDAGCPPQDEWVSFPLWQRVSRPWPRADMRPASLGGRR
jgi:hypothetical protein